MKIILTLEIKKSAKSEKKKSPVKPKQQQSKSPKNKIIITQN